MADFKSWRRATLDQFAAEAARKLREQAMEIDRLRALLKEAAPHVYSAAGAEHLLDGFKPQRRPMDDLAERVRQELEPPKVGADGTVMKVRNAELSGRPLADGPA